MTASEPTPHHPGRGVLKAAAYAPRRVAEALAEFQRLNTREARAAFADHWIGLWARDFDDAWPMVYELMRIVEEDGLFRDSRRVGPNAGGGPDTHGEVDEYASFKEYFEDRVKRPFKTWADLEGMYHYARDHAPELFDKALGDARDEMERKRREYKEAVKAGDGVPLSVHGEIGGGHTRADNISSGGHGTSESYLRRRLKRDRPDLYEQVNAGQISTSAAALEAGFRKPTQSVRVDSPESAAKTLRKHMPPEARQALARLLLEE